MMELLHRAQWQHETSPVTFSETEALLGGALATFSSCTAASSHFLSSG